MRTACHTCAAPCSERARTQLLEVYALEIQIATEQRNNKRLKQLYTRALGVKSAIPHPRVMGIIRECGGKMHLRFTLHNIFGGTGTGCC